MWRNVKALEEENKRLRKEREEWVNKALELSKRLNALNRKAMSGLQDNERLGTLFEK